MLPTALVHGLSPSPDIGIQCWGDSLTAATSAVDVTTQAYPVVLGGLYTPRRMVYNGGVGGETAAQIATRQTGYVTPNTQINVIWAGRNGVLTLSAASIVASVQSMVDHVGSSRYVVLSVINKTDGTEDPGSANRDLIIALNTALQAAFPANYLDVLTMLDSNALRVDGLHLTAVGYALVAASVKAKLDAIGA